MKTLSGRSIAALAVAALAVSALAGDTKLASVNSAGDPTFTGDAYMISTSRNGRFVVFTTTASDHVPGDTNQVSDVYLYDRKTRKIARASLGSAGAQPDSDCLSPRVSDDGRYVVFSSAATNLVPTDGNDRADVFVRDMKKLTTIRVSQTAAGGDLDGASFLPAISADGRTIAFASTATNAIAGDGNGQTDVFVRKLSGGPIERVSVGEGGVEGEGYSSRPALSKDGRYVVFDTNSTAFGALDSSNPAVVLRDRKRATTKFISLGSIPSVSDNGAIVAFQSQEALIPGDTNGANDVYVAQVKTLALTRISVGDDGAEGESHSQNPTISGNGRYVAFDSENGILAADTNRRTDVYVHDLKTHRAELVSVTPSGVASTGGSYYPWISANGKTVAFIANADDIFSAVENQHADAYVRQR